MKNRLANGLVAATVATMAFIGMASPASATHTSVLRISQDSAGQVTILEGETLDAGFVRTSITSTFGAGDVEVFQLRDASLPEMDAKINEAGQGGAVAAAAMRWFNQHTTFYGGLSAAPGAVSYLTVLDGGCYFTAQVNSPSATAQPFQVVGNTTATLPPTIQSVRMVEPDRFVVSGPGGKLYRGPLTIANSSEELHFVRFIQIQPKKTNADVATWLASGLDPALDPSLPGGATLFFGTQSPARASVVNLTLPGGKYMLLDFIPDDATGVPHAFGGMHTVVTVA